MSYKHHIRFNLEQDYYIDAVTYRWAGANSAKIEAKFYTDKPLDERKALLFVLAWHILSEDKKYHGFGRLTLKSYSDVKLSVEEVERSDDSVLCMDNKTRDRISICEPNVMIEQIIDNWVANTDTEQKHADWHPTDEELLEKIFKRSNKFRTYGY